MEYHKNLSLEDLFYINDDGLVCCEEWKDIPDYVNLYQASDLGRIKSLPKHTYHFFRILKPKINNGYLTVKLCKNKVIKTKKVHRLIGATFIPNPENKPHINHKKGIKTDNRVVQIEWNTILENNKHAYTAGLKKPKKSKDCNFSKLLEAEIKEIKENKNNLNQRELGELYNTSQSNISYILNNKTWKLTLNGTN